MANERLIKAYEEVFDAQGNVRACGRGACITLIEECEKKSPYTYFGDTRTGRMDVEAIKSLLQNETS